MYQSSFLNPGHCPEYTLVLTAGTAFFFKLYEFFYVATSPEQLDRVQAEMLDEIAQLREGGLEPEELERARAAFLGREVIHLQGARELAGVASIDELLGLGWDHYRQTTPEIEALENDFLREVATRTFEPEGQVVVRLTR